MSNHGFIDPGAHERERIDRLELLITEALSQLTVEDLSPEAQAIVKGLNSSDPQRRHSAQLRMKELMDADPLLREDIVAEVLAERDDWCTKTHVDRSAVQTVIDAKVAEVLAPIEALAERLTEKHQGPNGDEYVALRNGGALSVLSELRSALSTAKEATKHE